MKKSLLFLLGLFFVIGLTAQHQISTNPDAVFGKIYKNEVPASKELTMITHSNTQNILSGNSVSCNAGGLHTNNSYWRVFDLANDFGISTDWEVASADVAVELATGADGTQTVTVNLYTLSGSLLLANLTSIFTEDFIVTDAAAGTVINLAFTTPVTVPAGSVLVYEFFTPDGQTIGNSFFIGSNADGETDAGYISAADCGISEPTPLSDIGFGSMNIVMNLWGQAPVVVGNTVTFNVDMTDSIASGYFVEGTDQLWLGTSINGWTMPGDDAAFELTESGTNDIYTMSVAVADGDYAYKYFKIVGGVSSWDNGEWTGDPNRTFTMAAADMELNDIFGNVNNSVNDITKGINVYPNPSNGVFNISVEKSMKLEVFDITGKLINNTNVNGVSNLELNNAGVYFLRFSNNEGSSVQRVVVK
jgi:hypothetical protein